MAFTIPTLSSLRAQTRDDMRASLPGADSLLRQNNLRIISDNFAALIYGLYDYLRYMARNARPGTAESDYLEGWAEDYGLSRKAATFASGTVNFTGTAGASVPLDTECVTSSGIRYRVTSGITLGIGATPAPVEALSAGAAGNQDEGTELTLTTAISGVIATASVATGGISGGADAEGDEALRQRLLQRLRDTPMGGALNDYERWALEVPGVTRVWPVANEQGAGTVTVRFMMDDTRAAYDGLPQGDNASALIPGSGDQQLVWDWIEPLRPVTADLFVVAPIADALNITITGLTNDTAETRAAIEAELRDMLRRDAEPGGTIYRSRIIEAISTAAGEAHHTLTLPAGDVAHATGHIAILGVITYA